MKTDDISISYGTKSYPDPPPDNPPAIEKVKIKPYSSNGGFMETPQFWMDLVLIGEKLSTSPPSDRLAAL